MRHSLTAFASSGPKHQPHHIHIDIDARLHETRRRIVLQNSETKFHNRANPKQIENHSSHIPFNKLMFSQFLRYFLLPVIPAIVESFVVQPPILAFSLLT